MACPVCRTSPTVRAGARTITTRSTAMSSRTKRMRRRRNQWPRHHSGPRLAADVRHLRDVPLNDMQVRVNHVLHGAVSIVTVGAWLPVWGTIALINRQPKGD